MRAQNSATVVATPIYIGMEEIETLNDIKARCFFSCVKSKSQFVSKVCKSVGATSFETITEESFPVAFEVAQKLLRKRGEEILRGNNKHVDQE